MTCSFIGLTPPASVSRTFPMSSCHTLFSSDRLGCRGRKGCFTACSSISALEGLRERASSSVSCRRLTAFLMANSKLGVGQKKRSVRPLACAYLQCRAEQRSVRRCRTRGLYRRGLKRTFTESNESLSRACQSIWGDQLYLWAKEDPSVARKKVKCWNYQGDEGEPTSMDWAALASLEQAIQFQATEETRLFFCGPATGDLAEIEAFCRLYRHAEHLHTAVMNALRTQSTIETLDKGPYRGDVPLVEEKVASGLAHLMALLHEGKSEVLGMRTTGGGTLVEEASPDDLPPFARLRKKVRSCCKTLEDALDSLWPAESGRGLATRTRMLKLKNACLDAGFPRPEGIPSHADIPNLAPVRLRPSNSGRTLYKNENVAFWRGGHITEVGLEWLVDKGFRTIVDLREGSAQPIAQSALPDAVASGKLKVVRIPVERGMAPSKEQVEEFAGLLANSDNKPLYLHTRAGVGRASAMVSRWREFVLRQQLQVGPGRKDKSADGSLTSELQRLSVDNDVRVSQEDALALEIEQRSRDIGPIFESLASVSGKGNKNSVAAPLDLSRASTSGDKVSTSADTLEVRLSEISDQANANGSVKHHSSRFDVTKNAFEAQRPVRNVLNRKAMSKFLKRRKVPPAYFSCRIDRITGNVSSAPRSAESLVNGIISEPAKGFASPGIRGSDVPKHTKQQFHKGEQTLIIDDSARKGSYDETAARDNGNIRSDMINGNAPPPQEWIDKNEERMNEDRAHNLDNLTTVAETSHGVPGEKAVTNQGDELGSVQGDMCASTTGVVRLQSRKKAEMFLVRTDGFSCTREHVKESTLAFTHPSTQQQMLMWKTPPRTVMLLKKLGSELTEETQEIASFLHHQEGMNVMVEPEVHDRLARLSGFGFVQTFYNQDTSKLHERVDFVVCLGGDGVILHASNLFRNAVPPVVSFNLGSLGFLTSHTFKDYKQDLQAVIHGQNNMMTGVYITLRMRLRCELYRKGKAVPGKVFDVLNEVVVDRGSSPYLCKIECYERNRLITKVQGDGVIVATPTGSTAYSTAAGGSMVHPNVPSILFTPICPHSLSFRPVILPDSALLELKVPRDARNNEWVSFDGKKRQQLSKGDSVRISMSEHPLPTVNKSDQTGDWFQSLVRCLNWNERLEQRPLSL